jgi:hypothetical protein
LPLRFSSLWDSLVLVGLTFFMKTLKERFEEKIMYEPNTGCWIWTAYLNEWGYGRINIYGKIMGAHRVSYLLHNGELNINKLVLHSCDNPACVNPNHLYLGTNSDNTKDKLIRNRMKCKLDKNQVKEIKRLYSLCDISQNGIAVMFNVSQTNIGFIVRNKTWNVC